MTLPLLAALAVAAAPPQPNIVFLLSDDQRHDALGCVNPAIRTPNLDALAARGVRFPNAFVTTPICAASRASLLTGLWERTHKFTFATPPLAAEHVDRSYPALLKQAGYRTGFVGKFGVAVPKGATDQMFDSYVPLNRTPYWKTQPDGTRRHLTDLEADAAVRFLDAQEPGRPFCLSVSFNAPHAEDNDPKQYHWQTEVDALFRDITFPVPATMRDDFVRDLPAFLRDPKNESRVRFRWRFDEPAKYQEMVRGYYRMITGVDLAVGRVLAALKAKGFDGNTVVVYASDNGYFLGERGFADKWYLYEPSIRVPLIVADPRGVAASRAAVAPQVALNVDLAPTLLDLAGVPVPASVQGRSLAPILRGAPPADWRRDFFAEHLFERKNIPKSEGVRGERHTYIRWFEQKPVLEELFDRDADPDQERNLAAEPASAGTLAAMRARCDALRDTLGGAYRRVESPAILRKTVPGPDTHGPPP